MRGAIRYYSDASLVKLAISRVILVLSSAFRDPFIPSRRGRVGYVSFMYSTCHRVDIVTFKS